MDILSHLSHGPKTAKELAKLLDVSEKTLYKHVNRLLEEQKLLVYPLRVRNRWSSLFSLPEHIELATSLSGYLPIVKLPNVEPRIKRAIEELRAKLLRNPEVDEILLEIGENPEDRVVRDAVYRIGFSMKWRPPAPRERDSAEAELERIIRTAVWLRRGVLKEGGASGASAEEIERAKSYMRRFPDTVPEP